MNVDMRLMSVRNALVQPKGLKPKIWNLKPRASLKHHSRLQRPKSNKEQVQRFNSLLRRSRYYSLQLLLKSLQKKTGLPDSDPKPSESQTRSLKLAVSAQTSQAAQELHLQAG